MRRLRILTFLSFVAAMAIFFLKKRNPVTISAGNGLVINKDWLVQNIKSFTPAEDRRPADQTFLTYPEWYLVFSPAEQAEYYQLHTATTFPFMSHTAQIWQSYKIVNDQIKNNFPVNTGYHFMIRVIGTSASAEYFIKSWYELLIGRLTDTYVNKTDEDKFNAAFTLEYVDFIKDQPWYAFDFRSRLKRLWTSTSLTGHNQFRKTDRKYILTSELLVKYIYGKLIGLGTKTVYDEALPVTAVLVDSMAGALTYTFKTEKIFEDNSRLIYLPRYDKFKDAAAALAVSGCLFKEIAGNNSAILITVIINTGRRLDVDHAQLVFRQPFASDLSRERVALAIPVHDLSRLLMRLHEDNIIVEHIFDY